MAKSQFFKTRADQDISLYTAYQKAKKANPRIRYTDWLNDSEAVGILNQYDKKFKRIMDLLPSESSGKQEGKGSSAKPASKSAPADLPGKIIDRRSL
jgi:hypothetical protein